ncbi:hypothetical protein [Xanthomonas sp. MUS 060]|uniref:hypothetical protein n=1 Tax=Xanthomonas sp. MUS 060 TaxID=1588031 RepID=UPI001269FD41|nr:hypothetical protein [Xanthomonas sp. MUS 060]
MVTQSESKWESAERIDLFFKEFDQTSLFTFSENDIERNDNFKVLLSSKNEIIELIKNLSKACDVASDMKEEQMDLYLLIKGHGPNKQEMTWKSSPFHFYDSNIGKICVLKSKDRERISQLIHKFSVSH